MQEKEIMKVWIDQDLCTGDGLCEEIAPDVFTLLDDGLAYVKEIVEKHHGTVFVESEKGKGSTFIVKLPLI